MTDAVIDKVMDFKRNSIAKAGRPSKMTYELQNVCKKLRQKGCKMTTIYNGLKEQDLMPFTSYAGFTIAYKKTLRN
jgi:hypothetical protein